MEQTEIFKDLDYLSPREIRNAQNFARTIMELMVNAKQRLCCLITIFIIPVNSRAVRKVM